MSASYDAAEIMGALYGPGLTGLKGALPREWAGKLREDIERLYASALQREGGAIGYGPKRHYAEIHPEEIRGFVEGRRVNSLAFNVTTVDVEADMGAFEIAPGTQWDDAETFEYGMFPPKSLYDRYEARA
ncbi:hypothetical protein ACFO9Q_15930 [Paenibacillus sp. GCM10023252]|uniref:hypothetical protein n=1 Tax=Paenibacillus sp. GCM10023252 TaxID=3252649 RepID=UPI003616408D